MIAWRASGPTGAVVFLAFTNLVGCDRSEKPREEEPGRSAPAPAPEPAPPAPKSWYEGTWTGQAALETQKSAIEADKEARRQDRLQRKAGNRRALPQGVEPAAAVPPQRAARTEPVELLISEDRSVLGTLGAWTVRGKLDERTLRARVSGSTHRGVLTAERVEEGLAATLRISSGDSLEVFAGQFLLTRDSSEP